MLEMTCLMYHVRRILERLDMSHEFSENIDILFQAKLEREIAEKLREFDLDNASRSNGSQYPDEGDQSLMELQRMSQSEARVRKRGHDAIFREKALKNDENRY